MTALDRGQKGRLAEAIAGFWLRLGGYRVRARRYLTPVGEIDLVAERQGLLVFVEVKQRQSRESALESLSRQQRKRIERAAEWYLKRHGKAHGIDVRFDVMVLAPWRLPLHIEDAWRR